MGVAVGPAIKGRITVAKLKVAMMERGLTEIRFKGLIIPLDNDEDINFMTVKEYPRMELQKWKASYVRSYVSSVKMKDAVLVYNAEWGHYYLRPYPKKRRKTIK